MDKACIIFVPHSLHMASSEGPPAPPAMHSIGMVLKHELLDIQRYGAEV